MFIKNISVNNLSYILPDQTKILDNISFVINANIKCGLIGKNGIGKTTLLKLLVNEISPSNGGIIANVKIAYFEQNNQKINNLCIADFLGIKEKLDAIKEIEKGNANENFFDIISDDWSIEENAKKELLNFEFKNIDLYQKIKTLSGGEITKLKLAKVFLSNADMLFFDEPTNNLDYASKHLFFSRLANWNFGAFIITHDRELLNLLNEIFELTDHGIKKYGGNYSFYKKQKETEELKLINELTNAKKEQKILKLKEEKMYEKLSKKKASGKIKIEKRKYTPMQVNQLKMQSDITAKKLKNKMQKLQNQNFDAIKNIKSQMENKDLIKIKLKEENIYNKIVLEIKNLSFSYGNKNIFNDFNLIINAGERAAIVGNNGSGKTTLLKLITKKLILQKGQILSKGNIIYVNQELDILDKNLSLLDNFMKLNSNNTKNEAYAKLAEFLFKNKVADKLVKNLSGGELLRATIACLIGVNNTIDILILDEPTNNLDIESIEILENALIKYNGVIIIVSHDKFFLDNIKIDKFINLNK